MKTFLLQTKNGETINTVDSNDYENALDYFADIKKLTKEKLIEIYQIIEK